MKNLVVILADQLRKDYFGCYGNPYVRTPNIDWVASRGVRFESCYVANPICMPNRISIFTGLYPRSHGMWTNGLMLPHELPTLADTLAGRGYDTINIGKMHFSPTGEGEAAAISPENAAAWKKRGDNIEWYGPYWGFGYVELSIGHGTNPIAHYGKWFHENGGEDGMNKTIKDSDSEFFGCTTMPEHLHDSIYIGTRSAQLIEKHAQDEKPFFLVASFPDPHHPFNPPKETFARYKDAPVRQPINETDPLDTRPAHYKQHRQCAWHRGGTIPEEKRERVDAAERDRRIRATYAMVDLIDQGVGMILNSLRKTGQLENTVIVITSDHGELMGDHGLWLKGPFFYDGLINVPLIVYAPGEAAPAVTRSLASSVDIYPTCCELLGVKIPNSCAGVSLRPAFSGGTARAACLTEYRNGYYDKDVSTFVYTDENYKFVQYQTGTCELTDRKNDPQENVNLAFDPKNERLVLEYQRKLLLELISTGSKFPDQSSHA